MTRHATQAPRFSIASLECFERPVTLRLPFRFGAATVRAAPQAFVRASIRAMDGRAAQGMAAEMMIPKWFDKTPGHSNERNLDDLRRALDLARTAYCSNTAPRTAFGHASFHYRALLDAGKDANVNALTMSYGAALVDRAILDALCLMRDVSFGTAVWLNLPGLDAALTPDLGHFDLDAFLGGRSPARHIAARHTVGMADPLTEADADVDGAPVDGLPVTLTAVVERYRHRYFKLKLCGDCVADIARLTRISTVLDTLADYHVTLDGNEQFPAPSAVSEFLAAFTEEPELARMRASTLYLEQPLPRSIALDTDVRGLAGAIPVIVDESDATIDVFPQARTIGYAGISSKSCKGVYKSLLNAARCARWNAAAPDAPAFITGEDLTSQPGLAVQQDLALAGLLGLAHVERNGHHYAAGFAGQHAPAREQQAFLAAHPDLYEAADGAVRLAIRDGQIALGSLAVRGFASGAWPDIDSLSPMPTSRSAPAISTAQP